MLIEQLVDINLLNESVESGLISVRDHKEKELSVFNYTPLAQYGGHNDATLLCRGLVADYDGRVVARPFPKFFNYSEAGAPAISLDESVVVTDKADGSLLIVFKYKGEIVCCTRGSFHSEQADLGRELLKEFNPDDLEDNKTYLMEVVGPDNIIVLRYDENKLIRIADIDNETGEFTLAPEGHPFPDLEAVQVFPYPTLGEALAAEPRKNAEGFVIFTLDGRVVKLKQEDYVELHRLVFSFNKRRVWEHMMEGKTLPEIKEPLPDEFYDLAEQWYEEIHGEWIRIVTEVWDYYWSLEDMTYDEGFTRKDFALRVQAEVPAEYRGYMFKLLDNAGGVAMDVLKALRPRAEES